MQALAVWVMFCEQAATPYGTVLVPVLAKGLQGSGLHCKGRPLRNLCTGYRNAFVMPSQARDEADDARYSRPRSSAHIITLLSTTDLILTLPTLLTSTLLTISSIPSGRMSRSRSSYEYSYLSRFVRFLRWAIIAAFAYLCAGELLPKAAQQAISSLLPGAPRWPAQQLLLLATLCVLPAMLDAACYAKDHSASSSSSSSPTASSSSSSSGSAGGGGGGSFKDHDAHDSAIPIIAVTRLLPLAAAAAALLSVAETATTLCSGEAGGSASPPCDSSNYEYQLLARAALEAVGLYSGRLARLDLGLCLLPSAKESLWMLVLGGGQRRLDYGGGMPLHRSAGWWCVAMSAVHSAAYMASYTLPSKGGSSGEGGLRGLWIHCFPVPTPGRDGTINRLGLVNGFGVLAVLVAGALALLALPVTRQRLYHVFQMLHMPLSWLFVGCCALHDREVLLFALPGIASWSYCASLITPAAASPSARDAVPCLLWPGSGRALLQATARCLPGSSGGWVELTITTTDRKSVLGCWNGVGSAAAAAANEGRGHWLSVRAPKALGREWHPFSVAGLRRSRTDESLVELSIVVSARQGDWSRALATLAGAVPGASSTADVQMEGGAVAPPQALEVEVQGPFEARGGWSLLRALGKGGRRQLLLMLAGGMGITGWVPGLAAHRRAGGSGPRYRLVWCVRTHADYLSLRSRLPPSDEEDGGKVVVYVTRGDPPPPASDEEEQLCGSYGSGSPARHNFPGPPHQHQALELQQPREAAEADETLANCNGSDIILDSHRDQAMVTALAALAGLLVGFWAIRHLGRQTNYGGGWLGLAHCAAVSRCLPLLAMLAAMVITASAVQPSDDNPASVACCPAARGS